jgi:hypothetical protein
MVGWTVELEDRVYTRMYGRRMWSSDRVLRVWVNSIIEVGGGGIPSFFTMETLGEGICRLGMGIGSAAEATLTAASTIGASGKTGNFNSLIGSGVDLEDSSIEMECLAGIGAIDSTIGGFALGISTILDLDVSVSDSLGTTGVYLLDFIILIPAELGSTSFASMFLK